MSRSLLALLVSITVSLVGSTAVGEELPPGPLGTTGTLQQRYDALASARLEPKQARAAVDIRADIAGLSWVGRAGAWTPFVTKSGKELGGWFRGPCTISYTPPADIETDELFRWTGEHELHEVACDEAVVLAGDDALRASLGIGRPGETTRGPAQSPFVKDLRRSLRRVSDGGPTGIVALDLAGSLDGEGTSRLLLFVHLAEASNLGPRDNDFTVESLFASWSPRMQLGPGEPFVTVLLGANPGEPGRAQTLTSHGPEPEVVVRRDNLDVQRIELDLSFEPTERYGRMSGEAQVTFQTRERAQQVFRFSLRRHDRTPGYKERLGYTVAAVSSDGAPLDFVHREDSLLVALPEPLEPGNAATITVRYGGNAIHRVPSWDGSVRYDFVSLESWYPQPRFPDRAVFRFRVCVPPDHRVATSGRHETDEVVGGKRCSLAETNTAIASPGLQIGGWPEVTGIDLPSGIRVRSFYNAGLYTKSLLAEAATILDYFEQLFGPCPTDEIDLVPGKPVGAWFAPAGLVLMDRFAVRPEGISTTVWPFIRHQRVSYLAHELAHQWWGNGIGHHSYRDQWMHEALASYAAMMYMHARFGAEDGAAERRLWAFNAARTSTSGSPALGHARLGSAWRGQTYSRAPFALHMLRGLVGDDAFISFLREVSVAGRGLDLTTEDLAQAAHKMLGPGADWIFEEWIRKAGLPRLKAQMLEPSVVGGIEFVRLRISSSTGKRIRTPIRFTDRDGEVAWFTLDVGPDPIDVDIPFPLDRLQEIAFDPQQEALLDWGSVETIYREPGDEDYKVEERTRSEARPASIGGF